MVKNHNVNISNKNTKVIEFESIYDTDLGYSYEFGFGRIYLFGNDINGKINEYQLVCVGQSHDKNESVKVFYEYFCTL